MKIDLSRRVHVENDRIAARLRTRLEEAGVFTVNLISAPGSGKTSLLEATAPLLRPDIECAVIVGDLVTEDDAERLRAAGVRAHQIETLGACHLDAGRIEKALEDLPPEGLDLLAIENVGNLVCPCTFDLGEDAKVVLVSLPEGPDKPRKYPTAFAWASAFVISKLDLAPHVPCDVSDLAAGARSINPDLEVFPLSSETGEGMDAWVGWLRKRIAGRRR